MFKKSTVGSQLPVQNNQYYLTVKSLKKLTNGDTVKLDQLICCTGKILKLAEKDEKDTSKLYIGSTDHHPIKIQKDECGTLKRSKQNWALLYANTCHFCMHF